MAILRTFLSLSLSRCYIIIFIIVIIFANKDSILDINISNRVFRSFNSVFLTDNTAYYLNLNECYVNLILHTGMQGKGTQDRGIQSKSKQERGIQGNEFLRSKSGNGSKASTSVH